MILNRAVSEVEESEALIASTAFPVPYIFLTETTPARTRHRHSVATAKNTGLIKPILTGSVKRGSRYQTCTERNRRTASHSTSRPPGCSSFVSNTLRHHIA